MQYHFEISIHEDNFVLEGDCTLIEGKDASRDAYGRPTECGTADEIESIYISNMQVNFLHEGEATEWLKQATALFVKPMVDFLLEKAASGRESFQVSDVAEYLTPFGLKTVEGLIWDTNPVFETHEFEGYE